jgi:hypothetical protein
MGNSLCDESRGDRVKYWETIAENLSRAGWPWGCVATVDREGANDFCRRRASGRRSTLRRSR